MLIQRLGWAKTCNPHSQSPTVISMNKKFMNDTTGKWDVLDMEFDYFIGFDAINQDIMHPGVYEVVNLVHDGFIQDWDLILLFFQGDISLFLNECALGFC